MAEAVGAVLNSKVGPDFAVCCAGKHLRIGRERCTINAGMRGLAGRTTDEVCRSTRSMMRRITCKPSPTHDQTAADESSMLRGVLVRCVGLLR